MNRIRQIIDAEGLKYHERVVNESIRTSDGDLRLAINQLQFMYSSNKLLSFTKYATINPYSICEKFIEPSPISMKIRDYMDLAGQNFLDLQVVFKKKILDLKIRATSKYDKLLLLIKVTEAVSAGDE